jgi:hypothetical protein
VLATEVSTSASHGATLNGCCFADSLCENTGALANHDMRRAS